ncbi:MAG: hypothetical protein WD070_02645, partial [Pirellulaceae bacterium]
SLARYFIAQGGKRKFIDYIGDGMKWNNWTKATQSHYGYSSLSELQVTWLDWVRRGSPALPAAQSRLALGQPGKADVRRGSPALPAAQTLLAQQEPPQHTAPDTALADVAASELQRAAPPATRFASASTANDEVASTSRGWYSRVRDEAIASRDNVKQASFSEEARSAEPADGRDSDTNQTVSRPQPVGRPEQIILEWSRPSKTSAAQPAPAPNPQHRVIPKFQGTLWR